LKGIVIDTLVHIIRAIAQHGLRLAILCFRRGLLFLHADETFERAKAVPVVVETRRANVGLGWSFCDSGLLDLLRESDGISGAAVDLSADLLTRSGVGGEMWWDSADTVAHLTELARATEATARRNGMTLIGRALRMSPDSALSDMVLSFPRLNCFPQIERIKTTYN
jgi:hypothetical protein